MSAAVLATRVEGKFSDLMQGSWSVSDVLAPGLKGIVVGYQDLGDGKAYLGLYNNDPEHPVVSNVPVQLWLAQDMYRLLKHRWVFLDNNLVVHQMSPQPKEYMRATR